MVEVQVLGVVLEETTKQPVVVLRAVEGDETLPIQIGFAEASAIAAILEKVDSPRPMTHDLLATLLDTLGATVAQIEISDLINGTFYGVLKLCRGRRRWSIDCRPSDAIALALRMRASIFVADEVFRKLDPEDLTEASRRRWMGFLDSLDTSLSLESDGEGNEGGDRGDDDDNDEDNTVN